MLALTKEYGFHMTPQFEDGKQIVQLVGNSEFETKGLVGHERALAPQSSY
jgi:hypothetical protein